MSFFHLRKRFNVYGMNILQCQDEIIATDDDDFVVCCFHPRKAKKKRREKKGTENFSPL